MSSAAPKGDRRRVAFIVRSLDDGEVGAAALPWIDWFAAAGHEVTAITLTTHSGVQNLPESVREHRLGRERGHGARVRALRRHVQDARYDALVAVETYPNLLAVTAARGLPTVTVLNEREVLSLALPGASLARRAHVALARRRYRLADVVTSSSHPIGAEMSAWFGVPASRSLVIPDPALGADAARARAVREPGAAAGVQLVLTCGLAPEKDPERVLHAAAALRERGIPADVVSFGGGVREAEMHALAARLGIPFVSHPDRADWAGRVAPNAVVVLPSQREGLGAGLVEAAAHGIPSVGVSTALGVADAVIPGVTGELALSAEPDAIADAVVAAAALEVADVDAWLARFTAASSGPLLERAIELARG